MIKIADKIVTPGGDKNSGSAGKRSAQPAGLMPVRSTLNARGVDNSRIGWDGSSVTIDGKGAYTPEYNDNGITYASPSGIRQLTDTAYRQSGDELVAARDYVTAQGYSGTVNWDGENVIIGGQSIKPVYVQDGIAYLPRSQADAAVSGMEDRAGIIGGENVLGYTEQRYGDKIDNALGAILEREEFDYDPEQDPAYQAYRTQYRREAEQAMRRVLNNNNSSITGASGAVLSEAMADRDAVLEKLTDMIPVLEQNAYNRYTGETQRLLSNLESAQDTADSYYDKLYTADRDAITDMVTAGEREREEKQRWIDNQRNSEKDYYENELSRIELAERGIDLSRYDQMSAEALRSLILENDAQEMQNMQSTVENAYNNAAMRGFFTADDEMYLPWLSGYRTGSGYSIDPWTAEAEREYDIQMAKQRAAYDGSMLGMY